MIREKLYNLGINIFGGAMKIAAELNPKAKLFVEGRQGLLQKIEADFHKQKSDVAWFHCASLGEFEQGRPVIEAFKEHFKEYKIVLTFFSPSGYEVQKNYVHADYIYYLPLDTPNNTASFVQSIKPKIAFFVKYEFWHNYLIELKKINSKIISFSTIFRADQAFFKNKEGFQQNMLRQFDYFFVQDQNSFDLLSSIKIENKIITGDTRFDRVFEISQNPLDIAIAREFSKNTPTLVIGSSWPRDIQALELVANQLNKINIIVAPHEINDNNIKEIFETFSNRNGILFSKSDLESIKDKNLLVIDNVGMLSSLYQYADFAFVGGAFGEGLHNILEPSTFGIPILFGKEYSKFKEAIDLVGRKGAFSIKNKEECLSKLQELLDNQELRLNTGKITKNYVLENQGRSKKIMEYCINTL